MRAETVIGFLALNDSEGLQADVCIAPKQSLKNVGLTFELTGPLRYVAKGPE
jgi:hypothetical protein